MKRLKQKIEDAKTFGDAVKIVSEEITAQEQEELITALETVKKVFGLSAKDQTYLTLMKNIIAK